MRIVMLVAGIVVLAIAGCGGDDESADSEPATPTVESVTACLEDAGLEVESQAGDVDRLLVNGGEFEGGTTIAFYASEEEASENATAAKDVTGGEVEQNGAVVAISQGGPESEAAVGCIS